MTSVTLPRSLNHVGDYKIQLGSYCRALKLIVKNELLFGSSTYLGEYDLEAKKINRSLKMSGNVLSLDLNALNSDVCYAKDYSVWSATLNLDTSSELSAFTDANGRLCVSGKYVLRCANSNN